jgi:hypothetical protein
MPPMTTRPRALETLYLAFELGNTEWTLAMTASLDQPPLVRAVPARDLAAVEATIARATTHFPPQRRTELRRHSEPADDRARGAE